MSLPSSEQLVRLFDFFKEEKLTDAGLQEVFDRAKELELSGLYKRMVQSARDLISSVSFAPETMKDLTELAVITGREADFQSAFAVATADRVAAEKARLGSLLILAKEFPHKRDEVLTVARELVRREFVNALGDWPRFEAWQAIHEISGRSSDYEAMKNALGVWQDEREVVRAHIRLSQVRDDVENHEYRDLALELLRKIPYECTRFILAAEMAETLKDEVFFEEVTRLFFAGGKTEVMAMKYLWLQLLFGKISDSAMPACFEVVFQNVYNSNYANDVVKIVNFLLSTMKFDAADKVISLIKESDTRRLVQIEKAWFFLTCSVGRAEECLKEFQPPVPMLEFELLCVKAKANKTPMSYAAMRQCVETLENGYFDGLLRVAEITGDPQDVAKPYELIAGRGGSVFYKLDRLLSLIRVTKQHLDRLVPK